MEGGGGGAVEDGDGDGDDGGGGEVLGPVLDEDGAVCGTRAPAALLRPVQTPPFVPPHPAAADADADAAAEMTVSKER